MRAIVLALGILVATQPAVPRYEVYAVRFAHVSYAESSLVAGAAKDPHPASNLAARKRMSKLAGDASRVRRAGSPRMRLSISCN